MNVAGRDREDADRQAVEPVGQVDGVGRERQHQRRERDVHQAERGHEALEERKDQLRIEERRVLRREHHEGHADAQADDELPEQLVARKKPVMRSPDDLEIVVGEANRAKSDRGENCDPDERVAEVGPEQRRHERRGQNQEAAHRRRAGLGPVRRRPFVTDHLPDLELLQLADHPRTEDEPERERRHAGDGGAERDVSRHVQHGEPRRQRRQQVIEHQANSAFSRATTRSVPMPREPFTSTRSPGRIARDGHVRRLVAGRDVCHRVGRHVRRQWPHPPARARPRRRR